MRDPEQLTIDDVRKLSPRKVDKALRSGRLDDLLGRPNRELQPPPLDPDQIERAHREGRLSELLRRRREWKPSTRERLRAMPPEAVRDALRSGELDNVLRGDK